MTSKWNDVGSIHDLVPSTWRRGMRTYQQATQTPTPRENNAANQLCEGYQCASAHSRTLEPSGGGAVGQLDLRESLENMACKVEPILIENADSKANICLVQERFNEAEEGRLELVCVMKPPASHDWSDDDDSQHGERSRFGSLVCTSLSWNCTGLALAAGFGRRDLVGWCDHPGALCTWNLEEDEESWCDTTNTIKVDNCIMCVAFHPQQPAIIAGGTFNGEVYLWDLSKDDPQISVSGATHVSHSEPISELVWNYNRLSGNVLVPGSETDKDRFQIITVSTDGQVLLWSTSSLQRPLYGYALLYPRLHSAKLQQWGGTCIDFCAKPEDSSTFIVGTEGGTIYRCALQHSQQSVDEFARQARNPDECKVDKINLPSPIKTQYEAHVGPVHSVKFSPFQKQIFATCGYDGLVCIYRTLQTKPILRLEPSQTFLSCACWSPFRPLLIAVGAGDGKLFLYDFQKSTLHPRLAVDVTQNGGPVSAVTFNNQFPQYLACSDGKNVNLYMMGMCYSKERMLERRQLARLGEAGLGEL